MKGLGNINKLMKQAQEMQANMQKAQEELANLAGTKQPVISQLEDAAYEGHSLSMLKRIADALNQRLEIRFVSNSPGPKQVAT